ncbi:MAG: hypothetical protein KGS45_05295 [Planctomycetes bacterium]|nr:hypothetical protein [Planctomycetota bacterium]
MDFAEMARVGGQDGLAVGNTGSRDQSINIADTVATIGKLCRDSPKLLCYLCR